MTKNKSKPSARSAKRKPGHANGRSSGNKPLKLRSNPRGGTDIIGASAAQVVAPASIGAAQNAMRSYVRRTGSRKENGMEVVTYDFHQMLSRVGNNTNNPFPFPSGTGYNDSIPFIGVSPYYIGGALAKVAKPFRRFRFRGLEFAYIPGTATSAPNQLAFGYNPRPDMTGIFSASEDGGSYSFDGLFDNILQLAAAAAGPVWAPVVLVAGGAAKNTLGALGEAALKWFTNRKPSSNIDAVLIEEFITSRLKINSDNLGVLGTWTGAVKTALAGASITVPDCDLYAAPVTSAMQLKSLSEAVRRFRSSVEQELLTTTQGMLAGMVSNYLPGEGQRNMTGFVMVRGTIDLIEPWSDTADQGYTTEGSSLDLYGDPLDVSDAANFPDHLTSTAGERCKYMTRTWSHTPLGLEFCDKVHALTGHRLHDTHIFAKTSLETHFEALCRHEALTKRETSLRSNLAIMPSVPSAFIARENRGTRVVLTPKGHVVGPEVEELTDEEYVHLTKAVATMTPAQLAVLRK